VIINVCGQHFLEFRNTHSKIFENILPDIPETSNMTVNSHSSALARNVMNPVFS
jgi:hypothetical protein